MKRTGVSGIVCCAVVALLCIAEEAWAATSLPAADPTSETRTTYYHSDVVGNTRAESDEQGTLTAARRYEPFGLVIPSETLSAETPRFSGKLREPVSGLDDFGARHFAAEYGRFLATDPVAFSSKQFANPQDLNLYSYALNNPLKYVDPTGRQVSCTKADPDCNRWMYSPEPVPYGAMGDEPGVDALMAVMHYLDVGNRAAEALEEHGHSASAWTAGLAWLGLQFWGGYRLAGDAITLLPGRALTTAAADTEILAAGAGGEETVQVIKDAQAIQAANDRVLAAMRATLQARMQQASAQLQFLQRHIYENVEYLQQARLELARLRALQRDRVILTDQQAKNLIDLMHSIAATRDRLRFFQGQYEQAFKAFEAADRAATQLDLPARYVDPSR